MATNFPGSLDAFTNPSSSDTLDNPPHDQQHADANDAIEAIETALLDGAPLHIDDANERVGIGTTSPGETLDVRGDISLGVLGSNAGRLLLDNTTDAVQRISVSRGGSTGQLAFHTGADTEAVRISASGNVGINDASPSYKLDVNGDINATGDLRIGGTAIGTWTAFTPTWGNLTVGNAIQSAHYSVINDICFVHGFIDFGSTTAITGGVYFTPPVAFTTKTTNYQTLGTGSFYQSSVYPIAPTRYSTSVFLFTFQASGTDAVYVNVSATRPVAYGVTTFITYDFSYPIA